MNTDDPTFDQPPPRLSAILRTVLSPEAKANVTQAYMLARASLPAFPPPADFAQFQGYVAYIYNVIHKTCIAPGSPDMREFEAGSKGFEIIDRAASRRGETVQNWFYYAQRGINGGMLGVSDCIFSEMQLQTERNYERFVKDRLIPPNDHQAKVLFVQHAFEEYGHLFSDSADLSDPKRYAAQYQTIIDVIEKARRDVSKVFRGM